MRLWSIHPKHLDSKGLVALWRESLLAQSVLAGKTTGYKNHPQLVRFKKAPHSLGAIASYLRAVADEADERNYTFNRDKIPKGNLGGKIKVTSGQIEYEHQHLLNKLKVRDAERWATVKSLRVIEVHPLFDEVDGEIESWEIVSA